MDLQQAARLCCKLLMLTLHETTPLTLAKLQPTYYFVVGKIWLKKQTNLDKHISFSPGLAAINLTSRAYK